MSNESVAYNSGDTRRLAEAIRRSAQPIRGRSGDYDALLDAIGDRRFVLLGEASHGTHEFYHERARITRRLIERKQFDAVAVEADWPDALRVDRYLRATSRDRNARQALEGFERFPAWMWRNLDVVDFIEWLHRYNGILARDRQRVGFYGLDLYSLFASIDQVLLYLQNRDPAMAARARARYACFDHCHRDSQRYAQETAFGSAASCEDAVVSQLRDMSALQPPAGVDAWSDFQARQNARVVKNAEAYYRTMFRADVSSWNLRDQHMAETLGELADHIEQRAGRPAKIVVWEHNSHIGDARATEMGRHGEWTFGQLARQRYGDDVMLIGFTTYSGTVTAASDWGGPAHRKVVQPALAESYEAVFHDVDLPKFMLPLKDDIANLLRGERLMRAIGVIYRPDTERYSHYFYSALPDQFDIVLHFDKTRAVEPLEYTQHWSGEVPETFPEGV